MFYTPEARLDIWGCVRTAGESDSCQIPSQIQFPGLGVCTVSSKVSKWDLALFCLCAIIKGPVLAEFTLPMFSLLSVLHAFDKIGYIKVP